MTEGKWHHTYTLARKEAEKGIRNASDVYQYGLFLQKLFAENGSSFSIQEGNGVLQALTENLIEGCLKKDPAYRFASEEIILQSLDYMDRAARLFDAGDYLALSDLAYTCHLPVEKCRLRPAAVHPEGFHHAVQTLLQDCLLTMQVDKYHVLHTFQILHDMEQYYIDRIPVSDQAILIASGMRCANYFGMSESVLEMGRRLRKLCLNVQGSQTIDPSDAEEIANLQVDSNLVMAVAATDMGEYRSALSSASQNIRMLSKIEKEQGSADGELALRLGRAWSSQGCALARLHNTNVMPAFVKALQYFDRTGRNEQDNRDITMCHILHYACETQDKDLYEQYASLYFRAETWREQTEKVLTKLREEFGSNSARQYYALYALLKGIYTFDPEGADELADLLGLFEQLPYEQKDRIYPLPLIFLYLGLIAAGREGNGLLSPHSQDCFRQALACDEDTKDVQLNIQMVILARIQWIYNEKMGKADGNQQLLAYILYLLHEAGWKSMEKSLREKRNLAGLLCFEEA